MDDQSDEGRSSCGKTSGRGVRDAGDGRAGDLDGDGISTLAAEPQQSSGRGLALYWVGSLPFALGTHDLSLGQTLTLGERT